MRLLTMTWLVVAVVILQGHTWAEGWSGFRGPGVRGFSHETGLAITWSETENLAWKIPLPGPGSSSPIVFGDLVFVTCYSGDGKACCLEIKTGKLKYSQKLPVSDRCAVYASPVAVEERLYVVTRKSGTFVLAAKPEFQIIAYNQFPSDTSDFNASPAIDDKCLFLRSNRFLYCIEQVQ